MPDGLTLAEAAALRVGDPRAYEAPQRRRDGPARRGDAGAQAPRRRRLRLRQQHPGAGRAAPGVSEAFEIPGFVPEYVRPLFCEGKGPFRWVVLSGDPADIAATDPRRSRCSPTMRRCAAGSAWRGERVAFQGLPARICWLGYGERARFGLRLNRTGPRRARLGADRHRPRSPRRRLGGLAQPRDRGHARRQRRHRRLAGAERAAEHRGRRHLGVAASRRRRGHRPVDSRRAW